MNFTNDDGYYNLCNKKITINIIMFMFIVHLFNAFA